MERAGHSLLCVPHPLPFLVFLSKEINPSVITVTEGEEGRFSTEGTQEFNQAQARPYVGI